MGLFYALTILALLTGLAAVFLLQPGAGMHIDPEAPRRRGGASYAKPGARRTASPSSCCTSFPNAFFGAFAEGEVLPVLLLRCFAASG